MPTINRKTVKRTAENKPLTENKKLASTAYNKYRKLRQAYLMEHPLCELCLKKGIIKQAEQVHHIRPILTGKNELESIQLAIDKKNLMALCCECHKAQHRTRE